jgi:hypothetical protein
LDLTINSSTSHTTDATACNTYTWSAPLGNGSTYTTSQTGLTSTSTNASGCPHVETLNLTISNSTSHTTDATACDSYTWSAPLGNGTTYSASGTHTNVSTNGLGCTHTETLVLTINNSTSSSESQSACGSYTWSVNGSTYTSSGTYTATGTNAAQCTDTKILVLTITPVVNHTTTASVCDSYTWSVNNQTYTSTGNFSVTTGCNTENLELTVGHSSSHTTDTTACGTYTWAAPGNGTTYTTNQTGITNTTTNASGCPHVETLNLTIVNESITAQPVAPFICATIGSTSSVSVSTDAVGASYQWQSRIVTATNLNPIWNNLTNNSFYSGVSTSSLGITVSSTLPAGLQYRVLVTGSCGVLTSNGVALTIITTSKAGTITAPASVCLGGDITFTLGGYAGMSIQWQSAPTNVAASFTNISGATSNVLALTSATASMNKAYRAVVSSSCGTPATSPAKVIVVNPTTVAGTITGAGTVCSGGGVTLKLVGNVGTSIQWQYSTDFGVTYTNAPKSTTVPLENPFGTTSTSSTASTYIVTGVTQNLYFKATVRSGLCDFVETPVVQVKVGTTEAGSIAVTSGYSSTVCSSTATNLTLSGNTGTIAWQKSVNYASNPAGAIWTTVAGTTASISTGSLLNTTLASTTVAFRANVTLGTCGTIPTDVFLVTVLPAAKGGVAAVNDTSGLTVCAHGSKTLKVTGNVGSIQWQSSTDGITYADVTGATSSPYTFTDITNKTWFKVKAKNGDCAALAFSNALIITISLPVTVTAVSAASSNLCYNTGTTLTLATGYAGTISWQKSTDYGTTVTPSWTTVVGAAATLASGNLTQNTAFRAKLTSGSCFDYTAPAAVSVKALVNGGTVFSGSQQLCATNSGTSLTVSGNDGNGTTATYQWQKAPVTVSATTGALTVGAFANVATTVVGSSGSTTATYGTGSLAASAAFRVAVTNDGCTGYSSSYVVYVLKAPAATSPSGVTTCNVFATTLSLPGLQQGPAYTYTWIKTATATATTGTTVGTSSTFTLPALGVGINYYRVLLNYAAGSCSSGVLTTAFTVNVAAGVGCKQATPEIVAVPTTSPFVVKAYPNPYSETFNLSLTTVSEDRVGIVVYDMTGRLIERREVKPSDMTEQQIGDHYPSGVYNVVVTQGEDVKTLRVIKR